MDSVCGWPIHMVLTRAVMKTSLPLGGWRFGQTFLAFGSKHASHLAYWRTPATSLCELSPSSTPSAIAVPAITIMSLFHSSAANLVYPRDDLTLPQFILDDVNVHSTRPARPFGIPCIIDEESGTGLDLETVSKAKKTSHEYPDSPEQAQTTHARVSKDIERPLQYR